MSYILGIDTGGTYTDAVIYDPRTDRILAKAKALTTREDLSVGIGNCLRLLDQTLFDGLCQVNLSTTLATNAIVEKRGSPIALFLLGDRPKGDLPAEYQVQIEGLFDIRGRQVLPLDEKAVMTALERIRGNVGAVAVSGFASVRNHLHEQRVKTLIRKHSDLPVVCAHELSTRLGYYDRTVTAVLNARLLSVVFELIQAVRAVLLEYQLELPLMIVTGNGSLVSEKVALERPIETVLSGPAASISGAIHLSGQTDGLVVDMGGTTTDIARLQNGKVKMDPQGAVVGGYRLHINAAEIRTYGLGGDSWIRLQDGRILVGPRRVYPMCRAVAQWPALLEEMCQAIPVIRQAENAVDLLDGFSLYLTEHLAEPTPQQRRILAYLQNAPHLICSIAAQLGDAFDRRQLLELEERDVIKRIAFTPTDVLHVDGSMCLWDQEASRLMAQEMARQMNISPAAFTARCRANVEELLVSFCRDSGCEPNHPIIGVGAPSAAWLPAVAKRMNCPLELPENRETANAVGAAVGEVSRFARGLIRYHSITQKYILFLPSERMEFTSLDDARAAGKIALEACIRQSAKDSDCENAKVFVTEETLESADHTFIECTLEATAEGRSKWLM